MDTRSRAAEDDSAERADHPNQDRLITFHWTIVEAPEGSVAKLEASQPAPLFVPDLPGVYGLRLVVTDEGKRDSLPDRMTLTAFEENAAPNARVGRDRSVLVGAPVDLDGNQSYDPEDTPLAFHWSLVSAPKGRELTDSALSFRDTATPRFTPEVAGTHWLRLQVSDGESTAEERVRVTAIAGDVPPTADAGPDQRVRRARPIRLSGRASVDPDAAPSPLDFSWSLVARPAGSTLTRSAIRGADTATPNFTPDVEGAYLFRLQVSDGEKSDADNVLVLLESDRSPNAVDATSGPIAMNAPGGNFTKARRPSFALSVAPNSISLSAGEEGAYRVTLKRRGKLTSPATLSVKGLPSGATGRFAVPMLTAGQSTTLTVRASATTPAGTFPLLVSATASVNGVQTTSSASVTLRVRPRVGQPPPNAVSCAGADLSGLKTTVYVSPQGADGGGCGQTTAAACKTIQQGINNCAATGCGVLVRHGLYPTTSTINLRDAVNVYGGCRFDGEPDRKYRTTIQASPAPGTPAVSASAINTPTTVNGLVVIGKDETASGTASIAMTVSGSTGLMLTGTVLWAGKGGDGAPGPTGIPGIPTPGSPPFCGQEAGVPSSNIWGELTQTIWTPSSGGNGSQDAAGGGGQQGGASLALILANASLPGLADQNAVVAGLGGRGGDGGQGGVRQASGSPFVAGSGGSGGNGGPSIAVALTAGSAAPASGDGIYPGRSALGGAGGAGGTIPNCQGAAGADGFGGAVADIASMQALPHNVLTAGQRLQPGEALFSSDGETELFFLPGGAVLCVSDFGPGGGCTVLGGGEGVNGIVMRADGNLCLWDPLTPGCTGTAGHPGAYLLVRNGGSAVVLDGPIVLWTLP